MAQKGPCTPLPALRLYAHPPGSQGVAQRRESVEKVPEREDGLIKVLGIARERHGRNGLSAPWGVRMGVRRLPFGLLGSSARPRRLAPRILQRPSRPRGSARYCCTAGKHAAEVLLGQGEEPERMQSLILDGLAVEIWCARRG